MSDTWMVIEYLQDAEGAVVRRQVVMAGLPQEEAESLARELSVGKPVTPEEGQSFVYVAEEAV